MPLEVQHGAAPVVERATIRRAIVAASVGNCVEWFDFAVYGYLAATIGAVFFPSEDPTVSLLSSFAVFGVAFFARPLGGFFFGPLGDKIGRQRTLATVILLMSGSTFVIGILPGYATVGILAPILLVVARLMQGFSAGGEFGGASTFMAEYSPDEKRGYLVSWLEFSTLIGFLLGAGAATVLSAALSDEAMSTWGWRIPFLIAGPLGAIGLYMRLRLEDTPQFRALENRGEVARSPLRETLTENWKPILLCGGFVIIQNVGFYIILTYMPTYLANNLDFDSTTAFLATAITLLVEMACIPFVGALSDRIGRKPLLIGSCIGFIVLTYPAFLLISQGGLLNATLGQAALGILHGLFIGTSMAALAELFPTRVRYGAFSIGYNISVAIFGGFAPFVATYLISATGSTFAPAFLVIGAAVASLIPILYARETARLPLRQT